MKPYIRAVAAQYAIKYALKYNPEWPSDVGLGGDCTNFVSQALYAGGWTMVQHNIYAGGRDFRSWYSGKAGSGVNDRSRTWAAAANFDLFLNSGGRAKPCKQEELWLGDVVQLMWTDTGDIHHTMIVTGFQRAGNKRIPLLAYHTVDTLQKPITEMPKNDTLNCWHINDWFEENVSYILPRAG